MPGRRCGAADPGVAIDESGRQYFSFLQCTGPGASEIVVATRAGPSGRWSSVLIPNSKRGDKPAIALGAGRAYVVWIAHLRDGLRLVLCSSSVDGGRRWSLPVSVNDSEGIVFYPSVAIGARGVVHVAWNDVTGIEVDRSTDGGRHFGRDSQVASIRIVSACDFRIPAQPSICLSSDPVVTADRVRGRTYVTWSAMGSNGAFDVFARQIGGSPHRVNPPDGRTPSDQFWPASAVDQSTGWLWLCFYDTSGDSARIRAFYSCTASADGGKTWAKPVRAADVASNETRPGAAKGERGREYGDYEGIAVADGIAHPIWTDSRKLATLREEIYTTRLTRAALK